MRAWQEYQASGTIVEKGLRRRGGMQETGLRMALRAIAHGECGLERSRYTQRQLAENLTEEGLIG